MKKILSLILACVMIFSAVSASFSSFAEEEPVYAEGTAGALNVFDEFTLGRWPNSAVKDDALIASLNEIDAPLTSYGFTHGYRLIVKKKVYTGIPDIKYADIDYLGERYRKVVFKQSRPFQTNGVVGLSEETFYFKWDPIQWTVADKADGKITAVASRVVTQQPYTYSFEDCTWEESFVRTWLSDVFYTNAFTGTERTKLTPIERYGTADAISIPNKSDIVSGMLYNNILNTGFAEGYAVLMGKFVSSAFANQKVNWLIMNDAGDYNLVASTSGGKYFGPNANTPNSIYGVKPMISIANEVALPGSENTSSYAAVQHTHRYDRPILHKQALITNNCESYAKYRYTCRYCDAAGGTGYFEDTDVTTYHSPVKILSDEAFAEWTNKAYHEADYYYTCENCGEVIKKNIDGTKAAVFGAIVPHEHQFKLVRVVEPTCTAEGTKKYDCAVCNTAKIDIFADALGHNPYKKVSDAALRTPAQGDQPATYFYTCSRCNKVLFDAREGAVNDYFTYYPNHEHHFVVIDSKAPTCTNFGQDIYACEFCGERYALSTTPALGHDNKITILNEATCTAEGRQAVYCDRCGQSYEETIAKLGHDFSVKTDKLYKGVDCQHGNLYLYACSRCGYTPKKLENTYDDGTAPIRHIYEKKVSTSALYEKGTDGAPDKYYYTCEMCGTVIKDLPGYETLIWSNAVLDHTHTMYVQEEVAPDCVMDGYRYMACKYCKYETQEDFEKLGHQPSDLVEHKDPTCTQRGYDLYLCTRCGNTYKENIVPLLHHDYSIVSEITQEADCTQNALAYMQCTRCGKLTSTPKEVPDSALGHNYVKETVEPDCGNAGKYIYTCSRCGDTYTEIYSDPVGEHLFALTQTIEPDCTHTGIKVYTCQVCGEMKEVEYAPISAHTFKVVDKEEPTCTRDGYEDMVCTVCNKEVINALPATGHTYETISKVEPTCASRGVEVKRCTVCGEMSETETPALGHDYALISTKEPDCTSRGLKTYRCSRCENVLEVTFGVLTAHNYELIETVNPTCATAGSKLSRCTVCGKELTQTIPKLNHNYILTAESAPTCLKEGTRTYTCDVCGNEKTETYAEKLAHNYVLVSATEADCTNPGVYLYRCNMCGSEQRESMSALGHDFSEHSITKYKAADCFHGDLYYGKCSRCKVLSTTQTYEDTATRLQHDYTKILSLDALRTPRTDEEPATYYYTCSKCGTVMCDVEGYETRYFSEAEVEHTHEFVVESETEATCTKDGKRTSVCSICGYVLTEITQPRYGHEKGQIVSSQEADCTHDAYIKYQCSRCERTFTEYGEKRYGHDFSLLSGTAFQQATCTENAINYLKCARCGEVSFDKDYTAEVPNTALGHTPVQIISLSAVKDADEHGNPVSYYYTCDTCKKVLDEATYGYFEYRIEGGPLANYPIGSVIEYGRWPQSLVTNKALINALSAQEVKMFRYGFGYGYDESISASHYYEYSFEGALDMQYGDFIYDGEKYRKVVVNDFRTTEYSAEKDDEKTAALGGTYFFKWDPIEWILVETKENHSVLLAKNVLDSIYNYRDYADFIENERYDLGWHFEQLAFSGNEKAALFNEDALQLPGYDYIMGAHRPILELFDADHLYYAPQSAYEQLLNGDESVLSEQRENAYGAWFMYDGDVRFYELSGKGSPSEQNDTDLYGLPVRPMLTLKNDFVPISADAVGNYPTEHTHVFTRKLMTPSAIKASESCTQARAYYYTCACCDALGTNYFEIEDCINSHLPEEVISEAALKQPATESSDAVYYYTCAVCHQVIKNSNTFTAKGTHLGEHKYVIDYAASTADCMHKGVVVYRCSICGDSYSVEVTEAIGHDLRISTGTTKLRTKATCSSNETYYKQYQCSKCGKIVADTSVYYERANTMNPNLHSFTVLVDYTAPTCTTEGSEQLKCEYCDTTNTLTLDPLGHDFTGTVKNGFTIESEASCGKNAVYHYNCTRCNEISPETYEAQGTALRHSYTARQMNRDTLISGTLGKADSTYFYTCMNCGKVDRRANHYFTYPESTYLRDRVQKGGEVTFGSWPQSKVSDEALIAQLDKVEAPLTSYGYRYTPFMGAYYEQVNMQYADITLNGETYRKVVIGSYRPFFLNEAPMQGNTFQPLNGYVTGTYYFKWEPIVWQVLSVNASKATLVAKNILDAGMYHNDYTAAQNVTWAESSVRAWLADTFYEKAFNESEKEQVLGSENTNMNHPDYGTRGGINTTDKVYLPSLEDVVNKTYPLHTSEQRLSSGTDYAVAQGLWAHDKNTADYMSRTPGVAQNAIVLISENGNIADAYQSTTQISGIKPMITVSMEYGTVSPDLNSDGVIDMSDISIIIPYIGMPADTVTKRYDLNENGVIDMLDLSIILLSDNYGM